MLEKTECLTCALADWSRTKTGALHPGGGGRCRWKFEPPPIAAAFYWPRAFTNRCGAPPSPEGGAISRREPILGCPCYQQKDPGA